MSDSVTPQPRAFTVSRRSLVASAMAASLLSPLPTSGPALASVLEDGSFRREVVALLRRRRPELRPELTPEPDTLRFGNAVVYLGNIFRDVQNLSGAKRDAVVLDFFKSGLAGANTVTAADGVADDFGKVRHLLRVQIIPKSFATLNTEKGNTLVHRPLSSYVAEAYAISGKRAYVLVSERKLTDWKITAAAVREAAISNLDRASASVRIIFKQGNGDIGRYAMFSPLDDFMSARVLCPGFNARLRKGLGDRFFVGIPNRLGLTAWSTDFSRSRAFEKIVADEYAAYGHPLSPELFVSESGVLRTANFAERAAHGV